MIPLFRKWKLFTNGAAARGIFIVSVSLICHGMADGKSPAVKQHGTTGDVQTKNSNEKTLIGIKEHSMNSRQWMAALCSAEGTLYSELRDALLQDSAALADFLDNKPDQSKDTSGAAIQYEIIEGWKNSGEKFKNYLAEVNSIDFETEKKKVTGVPGVWRQYAGIAKIDYGEIMLPLCWEVLLKYGNEWNSWIMNIFITAVEYMPNRKSIAPLIRYMEKTTDLPQHRFAGTKLGFLASSLSILKMREQLAALKLKHNSISEGFDEAEEVIKREEERKK